MRAVSQIFPFTYINPLKIMLFLFFIITGCSHLHFVEDSVPPNNVEVERSYFPNGNSEYEAEFINGKLDGISRVWLENGSLTSESEYSNGYPHGIWTAYHPNGSLMSKTNYEYGKKHGDEIWFYDNGQIKSEQKFINGTPKTQIIRWKPDGTLVY